MGSSRERQHDRVHEGVDQSAVNESAENGAADHECQLSAGEIVDGRRAEGDDKVKEDSEHRGLRTS